jgi:ornithine--oxo-acid transaminase
MVRAPVHGSTFSKNDLAMAAGWATLEVIQAENLVENAAKIGEALLDDFRAMIGRYDYVHAVRGKGLLQAIEFAPPQTLGAKMAWKALDSAQEGLFGQLVIVPLFQEHRILCQTASHHHAVVKFLPPLVIGEEDRRWIVRAVDQVVANTQQIGGAIWDLGKRLAAAAIRTKTGR